MKFRINVLLVAAIVAATLMTSCLATGGGGGVGRTPNYPAKLSPEITSRYNDAQALYAAGKLDDADKAFEAFIAGFEYNEYTDMAKFKRGEIRFDRKKCEEALPFYKSAGEGIYNPAIVPQAHTKASICLFRLKRYGEAIDEVNAIHRADASADLRVRADSIGMIAAKKAEWPGKRIVRFSLFLMDDYAELAGSAQPPAGPEIIAQKDALEFVHRWVDDATITGEDLALLPADAYAKKTSGGYYLYKKALVAQKSGDYKDAAKLFKNYVGGYAKHEYYDAAQRYLSENSARTGRGGFKVGVILPLTGQYQIYGESVQHGVECALGTFAPCEGPKDVQMILKDSQGDPTRAAQMVGELADEGAQAIIGPLLSAEVNTVATEAQKRGIPLIMLTQREGVTAIGDYIFRNSITTKAEIAKLVDYAMTNMKLKKFAIYYPRNNKGEEFKQLFTDRVQEAGGRIVESKSYNPKAPEIGGTTIHDPSVVPENERENIAPVRPNYDALFIPGAASAAAYIASSLAMSGIEGIQLLGTMRWSESSAVKKGAKYLEGSVYVTALDKNSSDTETRNFFDRYQKAYNAEPTLLEGLGYDSMRLILDASANGARKRETIKRTLADIKGFHGATGVITMDENRDARRTLKVMRIKGGQATVVE